MLLQLKFRILGSQSREFQVPPPTALGRKRNPIAQSQLLFISVDWTAAYHPRADIIANLAAMRNLFQESTQIGLSYRDEYLAHTSQPKQEEQVPVGLSLEV